MRSYSFGLTVSVAAGALLLATSAPAAVTFLAHYDGNTGNSGLNADFAAGSVTATQTGGTISNTGPKFGAGSLDGTTAGELSYATAGNFNKNQRTIEMWFNLGNVAWEDIGGAGYAGFFSIYDTNSHDIRLYKDADESIGFYEYDSPPSSNFMGADSAAALSIATNTWHHLAWDYIDLAGTANDRSTLYLNGQVIANTTAGLGTYGGTLPAEFEIGTLQGGTGQTFQGLIDEVRISDTAHYGGVNFTPPDAPFVPEPTSLSLLALGALALRRRK